MANYGDMIGTLPTDNTQLSSEDQDLITTLFEETKHNKVLAMDIKDSLIVGTLVVAMNTKQVDDLIRKFIPFTSKSFIGFITVKIILTGVLYWIIKYISLAKKS